MYGFAGASLHIKNVLKRPQLLKVVLLADASKPKLGLVQNILAYPSGLKGLAEAMRDRHQCSLFSKSTPIPKKYRLNHLTFLSQALKKKTPDLTSRNG